jgi:hypothetical protein
MTCAGRPIPKCTTNWDTGNVQVTVNVPGNPITASTNYGMGATAQTLANTLAGQFSATNLFNTSVANTTGPDNIPAYTVTVTAKATGVATDYSYSASYSFFRIGGFNDFTATTAGAAFAGGVDGRTSVVDSGTIVLKLGNFTTPSVCYGSACNSTSASIAGALAAALNSAPGSPITGANIQLNGSTITLTTNQNTAAWNGTVSVIPTSGDPADFPSGSFGS